MRSPSARQYTTVQIPIGTGASGSIAILAGVAGKIPRVTYAQIQVGVTGAQSAILEFTAPTNAIINVPLNPVGQYAVGRLEQGIAGAAGAGIQLTLSGAGNAYNVVLEVYYDS